MYPSVAPGNHNITVTGTTQDGQVEEVRLGPLQVSSSFMITSVASALGTVITVSIDAPQNATFERQLDNEAFVPCKRSTISNS